MAKKKVLKILHICKEYKGYLDEMPQEAKDALVSRNSKAAKLFEKLVAPAPIVE